MIMINLKSQKVRTRGERSRCSIGCEQDKEGHKDAEKKSSSRHCKYNEF